MVTMSENNLGASDTKFIRSLRDYLSSQTESMKTMLFLLGIGWLIVFIIITLSFLIATIYTLGVIDQIWGYHVRFSHAEALFFNGGMLLQPISVFLLEVLKIFVIWFPFRHVIRKILVNSASQEERLSPFVPIILIFLMLLLVPSILIVAQLTAIFLLTELDFFIVLFISSSIQQARLASFAIMLFADMFLILSFIFIIIRLLIIKKQLNANNGSKLIVTEPSRSKFSTVFLWRLRGKISLFVFPSLTIVAILLVILTFSGLNQLFLGNIVSGTGTIEQGFGGYSLVADDGRRWELIDLVEDYRSDELRVRFIVKIQKNQYQYEARMVLWSGGLRVEVIHLEPLFSSMVEDKTQPLSS